MNEDHTLGHVLENACWIQLSKLLQTSGLQDEEKTKLYFSSLIFYRRVHPLDTFIELAIRVPDQPLPLPPVKEPAPPAPIRLLQLAINDLLELLRTIEPRQEGQHK
jgi:DNA-directed RNA polymerase subunit L